MSDIFNRILDGSYQFEAARPVSRDKPTKLLLGAAERKQLQEYLDRAFPGGTGLVNIPGPCRSRFLGMEIYPVDDESFLGFA